MDNGILIRGAVGFKDGREVTDEMHDQWLDGFFEWLVARGMEFGGATIRTDLNEDDGDTDARTIRKGWDATKDLSPQARKSATRYMVDLMVADYKTALKKKTKTLIATIEREESEWAK